MLGQDEEGRIWLPPPPVGRPSGKAPAAGERPVPSPMPRVAGEQSPDIKVGRVYLATLLVVVVGSWYFSH